MCVLSLLWCKVVRLDHEPLTVTLKRICTRHRRASVSTRSMRTKEAQTRGICGRRGRKEKSPEAPLSESRDEPADKFFY